MDITAGLPDTTAGSIIVVDILVDENDGAGVGTGTSLRDAIAEALQGTNAAGTSGSGGSLILFDASLLGERSI